VKATTQAFVENARKALDDERLQTAIRDSGEGFLTRRRAAVDRLPEFGALCEAAREIKTHTLQHLDLYYEQYEEKMRANGGHLHFAPTAKDACQIVLEICRKAGAKTITKGKSMVTEEIGLNDYLEAHGLRPVETDLGEYIVQIRGEGPSHIIAPAIHLSPAQVAEDFRRVHTDLDPDRRLDKAATMVHEARAVLREKFLAADIGITGANFLIAETGSSVIVTNEGNGDLTQSLPRVHIVVTSLEKMVPTLEDVSVLLRVLARSATGQELTVYTTFSTGPRRAEDEDGPQEYHVVVLDNGRSAMLGGEQAEMLRCIRCGACMNHCPVYQSVGGHAYGWVYPGPMGAVLNPQLLGVDMAGHLPNASTFCGRCEEICPVRIPLPHLMRNWRKAQHGERLDSPRARLALKLWLAAATRPRLYRALTGFAARILALIGGREKRIARLPLASGWTAHRDLPAPEGRTFMNQWRERKGGGK
jgi:L-lactate dehydrogenase complex protein LldF